MDVIIGLTTKDAVIVATSMAAVRGVSILKSDDDKTRVVAPHTLVAYTGEPGDTVQFAEYVQANIQLHGMRNETELSPPAITSFVRSELAKSLRSRKPYQVNILIAGYDTATEKPYLYWVDYLASSAQLPYAAHGYAAYYTLSLLDRWHKKDISLDEGMKIMEMCVTELRTRLPIDFKGVQIKIIDRDGVRTV
ncbi:nucleophile aminohydrolase [Lipomyces tetrasporus]|uniref:Proteasome subunit beta n=1 Tax=Lipomyces tetrasporus TaxID=54092 RepID=A0AAD7VU59_9ASCO|nr:nucleophile aminohydrolase [Lipomyces tetrasporus]KAJ8102787.1 nucleophile aminohydrolase [Lipomyces tetrasporus]